MLALIVDPDERRCAAIAAELARHGHRTLAAPALAEAPVRPAEAEIVVLGVTEELDAESACRDVRGGAPGGGPLLVVAGPPGVLDRRALMAAGATDVWPLEPGATQGVGARLAIAEHYARLQAGSVRLGGELALLRRALDLADVGFVLTDPQLDDNPVVYANAAFHELTGYPPEEVLGRNCRFLQGPATEPDRVARLRESVAAGRPITVQISNHRHDGTSFLNEVHVAPIRDEQGRVVRFVGVQVDVSAHRRHETLYALEQRARRAAEAAERRSSFLAEASPLLDASLDLRLTLESLVRLTVPGLCDICLVDVLEGRAVRRVAFATDDPAVERALHAQEPRKVDVEALLDDPVARVVRTGRAEVLAGDEARAFGGGAEGLGGRTPSAAMLVPLKTRGRTFGVLGLGSLDPRRRYDADELTFAGDLARRAALAVDNARLFEEQSHVARTLQDGLLPDALPDIAGVDLAAAFRPAGDGTEVGGDFYDAFPAADGSTTLAIGDVAGKGASAAALTALTRHTLRTAGMYERDPSMMLATLNRALLVERGRHGRYCTVALAQLVPGGDGLAVRVACAGHPPPLVLRAGGRVEPIGQPGTLLGYVEDPALHDTPATLAPGDALVLYTDGLTEARTRTGMLGDDRLAALVRGCAGLPADAIASRIEQAAIDLQGGSPRDDIAIVVARVHGSES